MKNTNISVKTGRRQFLKNSATMAASTMLLPLGTTQLFGNNKHHKAEVSIPMVTLNNGIQMPILGFGTNTLVGDIGINAVADAISVGFRLIDTATIYEGAVRRAGD